MSEIAGVHELSGVQKIGKYADCEISGGKKYPGYDDKYVSR